MDHRQRAFLASAGVVGLFLIVQVGAVALVEPFQEGGFQEVEDTGDPSLSILYVLGILLATALMLGVIKYGGEGILRVVILLAATYIAFFVFSTLFPTIAIVGGVAVGTVLGLGLAALLGVGLYVYPEWYVIDAAGIVMGIGAAGLFGINFGILPALVLLIALAVYDAISVYGTEHMLTLASGMMDMRVPVVFIVPLSLSYSFLDETTPDSLESEQTSQAEEDQSQSEDEQSQTGTDQTQTEEDQSHAETDGLPDAPEEIDPETLNELGAERVTAIDRDVLADVEFDEEQAARLDDDVREALTGGERDALFIGLGDAVIPTVLVASAAFFVDAGPTLSLFGISASLPALTAIAGTTVGLVALLWLVHRGRVHAGLPLLNGGAIAGYLLGALASGLTLVEALGLEAWL